MPHLIDIDDKDRQAEVTLLLRYREAISSLAMYAAEAPTLGEMLERAAEASHQFVRAQASAVARRLCTDRVRRRTRDTYYVVVPSKPITLITRTA